MALVNMQVSKLWPMGLLFVLVFPGPISIGKDTLWAQLLQEFSTIILKLYIFVLHGLKMCMWFGAILLSQPYTDKAMGDGEACLQQAFIQISKVLI